MYEQLELFPQEGQEEASVFISDAEYEEQLTWVWKSFAKAWENESLLWYGGGPQEATE